MHYTQKYYVIRNNIFAVTVLKQGSLGISE